MTTIFVPSAFDSLDHLANAIAKRAGFGRATTVLLSKREEYKVSGCTSYGFRKVSNGEYVPRAYVRRFGWKNTYYQRAECTVVVPARLMNFYENN